jgi:hypothetical protein
MTKGVLSWAVELAVVCVRSDEGLRGSSIRQALCSS